MVGESTLADYHVNCKYFPLLLLLLFLLNYLSNKGFPQVESQIEQVYNRGMSLLPAVKQAVSLNLNFCFSFASFILPNAKLDSFYLLIVVNLCETNRICNVASCC